MRVERCVEEIDLWMCKNLLKLNQDKTELVVISSKFRIRPNLEYVLVGVEFIAPKSSARNLGVIMDRRGEVYISLPSLHHYDMKLPEFHEPA